MAMAQLPVPMALDIHDVNAADKWRKFFNAWTNYALATELDTKPHLVSRAINADTWTTLQRSARVQ